MPVNAEQLAEWLEQNAAVIIPAGNPDTRHIKVSYVLNWGGFCNYSFTISDGSKQYHLKITNEQDRVIRLQRWLQMHVLLEERYCAPKLIGWVDLPEIGFAGLLFEHIDGRPADFRRHPDLLKQVIDLVYRLHTDTGLHSDLASFVSTRTYLDFFVETYIDRFTADLEIINADRPAFVTTSLMQWMNNETLRLREKAGSTKVFQALAIEPVHGDLHEGNIIVTCTGWFIVDWDDLTLGDPALELAILVWPLVWQGEQWQDFIVSKKHGFAERMELCIRAQLLDEVIDNIADYVEAESVPSRKTEVQLAKKRRHEEALHRYGKI